MPDAANRAALESLLEVWPRGLPVRDVFPDAEREIDHLLALHRAGLVELRCVEPGDFGVDPGPLNAVEAADGYATTPYHSCESTS